MRRKYGTGRWPARAKPSARMRTRSRRSVSPISAKPWWRGTNGPASRWRERSSGRTAAPPISAPTSKIGGTNRTCRRAPGSSSIPISPPPRCAGCSIMTRQCAARANEVTSPSARWRAGWSSISRRARMSAMRAMPAARSCCRSTTTSSIPPCATCSASLRKACRASSIPMARWQTVPANGSGGRSRSAASLAISNRRPSARPASNSARPRELTGPGLSS